MAEHTPPETGGMIGMPPLCGNYCPTHCPSLAGIAVHIAPGPRFADEAERQAYYERLVERYIVPALRRQGAMR